VRPDSKKPVKSEVTAAVNTKKLSRQLAGIMAHLEHHPNDQLSRARVAKIEELLRG
jgi:ribosomal protein S15P/S13E